MKQSLFRRGVVPLVLTLCLMAPLTPGVMAMPIEFQSEEEVQPCYIGTFSTSASIAILSGGIAECWGYVDCHPGYTAKNAVMRLQWLDSDGVWMNYYTWYGEGNSVDFYGTKAIPKGRTYRVRVVADVYDSNGNWVEMVDAVSGSEKY